MDVQFSVWSCFFLTENASWSWHKRFSRSDTNKNKCLKKQSPNHNKIGPTQTGKACHENCLKDCSNKTQMFGKLTSSHPLIDRWVLSNQRLPSNTPPWTSPRAVQTLLQCKQNTCACSFPKQWPNALGLCSLINASVRTHDNITVHYSLCLTAPGWTHVAKWTHVA